MISCDFPSIQNYGIDTPPKERPLLEYPGWPFLCRGMETEVSQLSLNLYSSYLSRLHACFHAVCETGAHFRQHSHNFCQHSSKRGGNLCAFCSSWLAGQPGWPFQTLPALRPLSWLSIQGSQMHWSCLPCLCHLPASQAPSEKMSRKTVYYLALPGITIEESKVTPVRTSS